MADIIVVIAIMNSGRFAEEEEESASIGELTCIQVYDGLDYSDEFDDSGSSNEQPLSQSRLQQLNQLG
jgi:hypothetical protein